MTDATFLDFGASKGGSIRFGEHVFGGRGHGIDISASKIEKLRAAGFQGQLGDVTNLPFEENAVNYVTMMNFLEHLPSPELGAAAIESAIRVASDFVFMIGPNFGHRAYLYECGFRKYFVKWSGHTWEHTVDDLTKILRQQRRHDWLLVESEPIVDSRDPFILPRSAPRNSLQYDLEKHGDKPLVAFKEERVFRWIYFVVVNNPKFSATDILCRAHFAGQTRGRKPRPLYPAVAAPAEPPVVSAP